MIDDITIAGKITLPHLPDPMNLLPSVPGRPDTYGRHAGHGLYVTYSPQTKIATVRISVPKRMTRNPVNFPLVPLTSVEDLRPRNIAREVASALEIRVPGIGPEIDTILPLRDWAVIRVSYAVDLQVSDPHACVLGAVGIERRNAGTMHLWGKPKSSNVEWAAKSLRVKFYAKQVELESHRFLDEDRDRALRDLVRRARRVLRFEASLRQVASIRRVLRVNPGHLPTLAIMCDPVVARVVLTREARRLRLDEPNELLDRSSLPAHVRRVVRSLRQAQENLAENDEYLGRLKTITDERLRSLLLVHFLGSAFDGAELNTLMGLSRPAVAELKCQLRDLNLGPDQSPFTTLGHAVREIARALEPYIITDAETQLRPWRERLWQVPAPWSDQQPLDQHDLEEGEDEQVGEGETLHPDRDEEAPETTDSGEDDGSFAHVLADV